MVPAFVIEDVDVLHGRFPVFVGSVERRVKGVVARTVVNGGSHIHQPLRRISPHILDGRGGTPISARKTSPAPRTSYLKNSFSVASTWIRRSLPARGPSQCNTCVRKNLLNNKKRGR